MIISLSTIFYILAPLLLVQYALTLFCLVKLVMLSLPARQFWVWNFFILLALVVGVVVFLICYFCFRKKVFAKAAIYAEAKDEQSEPIVKL